jgi:Ulp1 family protease
MAIENVYSYLEYLALTVDQLADAVIEREEESAVYEARLLEMSEALAVAQSVANPSEVNVQDIIDQAEARIQLAEARAAKAEEKAEELAIQLKAAKQQKKTKFDPQIDMFAAPSAPTPIPTKSNKVANDENALILAKKLDSTIDKVQKLIREARA